MWKLFFKNKKTEILNWMHFNYYNVLMAGVLVLSIMFAIGFALFLIVVPEKIQLITYGFLVLCFIVTKWVLDKSATNNQFTTYKVTQNGKVAILRYNNAPKAGHKVVEYRLSFKAEGKLDKGDTTIIIEDDSVYSLIKHLNDMSEKENKEAMSIINDFFG